MKRMACLLGVACLLGQTVGTLHPSSHEALPKGGDAALPFVISAAYPFWRASIYPPAAIPFHYVHQIRSSVAWQSSLIHSKYRSLVQIWTFSARYPGRWG